MKTINKNKILALTAAGAIAFADLGITSPVLSVQAAQQGSTKMTLTVGDPAYDFVVPADTSVSSSGWSTLASDLIIKNLKCGDKVEKVVVDAESTNGFKFKNGNDEIGYELRTEETGTSTTSFDFEDIDKMTGDGEKLPLGVQVDDFTGKKEGSYIDDINWTAKVILKQ